MLAGELGLFVLRLQVWHCELNPIEHIWANCKSFVARKNTTFKMADVETLINSSFRRITELHYILEKFVSCDDHILKIEDNWKTDLVAESTIQPVVINLASGKSDSA